MRPLFLLPLVALLACASEPASTAPSTEAATPGAAPAAERNASPSAAPADSSDVRRWLAEVQALEAQTPTLDYDSLVARSLRLANRIDPLVGWRRACDTYNDPSTGEAIHEPTDPAQEATIGRGLMTVSPLGGDEAAVAVLCYRGAYQGSWALIHVEGDHASLVRTAALSEDYQPTPYEAATFGEPLFVPDGRQFTTFVKSRGPGDCGAFTRYQLGTGGEAEILEVRARDCADEVPEDLDLDPTTWPVVYSAE